MKLAIVAGEASGDLHAAHVVRELRRLDPDLRTFGLFNVIRHLPMFRRVMRELVERIERERPDAVLLVDYPEFNLRVAKRCRELGIKVLYYISPQIWAWRRGRVRHIAETVDHMIVLFPFEERFYREHGVAVTYAGHPIIEQVGAIERPPREEGVVRLALLPGSRRGEVDSLLPPMLDAVADLRRDTNVKPFIVQAPTIERAQLDAILREKQADVPIVPHDHGRAVAASDVALSSSGTATLECAVLGTPAIVMYRLSPLTYQMAKRLVKLRHFGLVNIVAEKEVVPELVQHDVTGERIASEVRRLIEPVNYARVLRDLDEVRARLGEPGASRRAAEVIVSVVR